MNSVFISRLWLDALAAFLLLLDLAYWWLGNPAHEIAGTALFLLLIAHNVFNRRWYGAVARTRHGRRSLLNISVTVALLIAMLALVATSVLISHALAAYLPAWGGFTIRQIHTLAAYWVLVIVAIHLGLRWPMLMGVARNLFGIRTPSRLRTLLLRAAAVTIAIHGAWSCTVLGLGTKLSMQVTLDWWNFEDAVAGFFIHCAAIAGLFMVATYYSLKLAQPGRPLGSGRPRDLPGAEPGQASQA